MELNMSKNLALSLQSLTVYDDKDYAWIGPQSGSGEIYLEYTISNNESSVTYKTDIFDLDDKGMNFADLASEGVPKLTIAVDEYDILQVNIAVKDSDWAEPDDLLGSAISYSFNASQGFG